MWTATSFGFLRLFGLPCSKLYILLPSFCISHGGREQPRQRQRRNGRDRPRCPRLRDGAAVGQRLRIGSSPTIDAIQLGVHGNGAGSARWMHCCGSDWSSAWAQNDRKKRHPGCDHWQPYSGGCLAFAFEVCSSCST